MLVSLDFIRQNKLNNVVLSDKICKMGIACKCKLCQIWQMKPQAKNDERWIPTNNLYFIKDDASGIVY